VGLRQQVRVAAQQRFRPVAEPGCDDVQRDAVRQGECRVRVSENVQPSRRDLGRVPVAQERFDQPLRVDRVADLVAEEGVPVDVRVAGERARSSSCASRCSASASSVTASSATVRRERFDFGGPNVTPPAGKLFRGPRGYARFGRGRWIGGGSRIAYKAAPADSVTERAGEHGIRLAAARRGEPGLLEVAQQRVQVRATHALEPQPTDPRDDPVPDDRLVLRDAERAQRPLDSR
jgi:hypothetical protein